MEEYLCKCTNCDNIMYDENPDPDNFPVDISGYDEINPMELCNEDGDSFWGCGNCQTDEFLVDIVNPKIFEQ